MSHAPCLDEAHARSPRRTRNSKKSLSFLEPEKMLAPAAAGRIIKQFADRAPTMTELISHKLERLHGERSTFMMVKLDDPGQDEGS